MKQGAELDFPIPVDDFAFSLHDLSDKETTISQQSAAILFCVEGDATLWKGSQQLQLKPGESAFIAANESLYDRQRPRPFSACLQQAVRAY